MTSSSKFVLACLFLLAAGPRAAGSGGGECDDMLCNSFFSPEIIRSPGEAPFFRALTTFYPNAPNAQPDVQSVNLNEWAKYYRQALPKDQLSFLLYKMSAEHLTNLISSLNGKDAPPLTDEAKALKVSFVKYGRKDAVIRSLHYLVLAKQVEPIATSRANDGWQRSTTPPEPDPDIVLELIRTAESAIPKADKFVAERYRFQVIRLMYYSNQFEDAQKYFEQNKTTFTEENSPKYRFMDAAAGAYYKDHKYGKANYLFSLVFDKFEPLKRTAYFSFHPMEEPDWNETLALARTPREREVLWQLLGIYADGLAAIDKIYAMNPRSKLLPLLLVREVNKTEEDWTSNQDRFRNGVGIGNGPRPDPEVVGMKRLERIKAVADARNTYEPYLWLLATGHLYALAGDSGAAETYVREAMQSMPDVPDIKAQARMTLLFARVRSIKAIDKGAEPLLAEQLSWLKSYIRDVRQPRARNLDTWLLRYLSGVYRKGSDEIRALMLTDSPESDVYRDVAMIDAVLEFMRTPQNAFDEFLVRNYNYSAEQLQELRAMQLLYAGDFARALETFKLAGPIPAAMTLNADPFTIHIKDCHDCDFAADHPKYSKVTFAERMLALSRAAQGQGQPAANASFELANGFYNMSYYGNGRIIYNTPHSNLSPWDGSLRAALVLNNDLAEKYYLQAANLSNDREFKAKAVFMAAKAEQNRGYKTGMNPRLHFKTLKDSYSNTLYYQEIIRECGYFRAYLGQ